MEDPPYRRSRLTAGRRVAALSVTDRQRQIIALIALGYSNAEIAVILYIQPETVKSHIRTALMRLSCRTRAQLVYRAIQVGVLRATPSTVALSAPSRLSRQMSVPGWNGTPEDLLKRLTKD